MRFALFFLYKVSEDFANWMKKIYYLLTLIYNIMKKRSLLKTMLLLFALIAGSSSVWADPTVLFHETFGDNSSSARVWKDAYSVKSGIALVYEEAYYSMTNVKQGKNTTGSTASGLNQSTKDVDAVFIVGPLNVAGYNGLTLKYKWKAASTGATYFTSASYATSASGAYTTIKTIGNTTGAESGGATSFIDCSYTIPAAACVSSLYLKIVFNTSNTQAIIDEVDLSCEGPALPVSQNNIPVATMSITSCTMSVDKKTWTNNDNSDYTLGNGTKEMPTKTYGDDELIKIEPATYDVTVPDGVTVTKIAITGKSNSSDGTPITVGEITQTIPNTITTAYFPIATPSAGAKVSITTATKEFGLQSIVLYTADGKTLTTTANMDGWRAFYDATQDYTLDANTKAYVVRAKSGTEDVVELTKLDVTAIPHGEPVILKTSAADHKMVLTKTTGVASLGTNLLDVTDGTHNYDCYRLGYGSIGVGFYKFTTTKAPAAGIVYLDPEYMNLSAGAPALSFVIADGNITAIKNVSAEKQTAPRKVMKDGRIVIETAEGMFSVSGARVK